RSHGYDLEIEAARGQQFHVSRQDFVDWVARDETHRRDFNHRTPRPRPFRLRQPNCQHSSPSRDFAHFTLRGDRLRRNPIRFSSTAPPVWLTSTSPTCKSLACTHGSAAAALGGASLSSVAPTSSAFAVPSAPSECAA